MKFLTLVPWLSFSLALLPSGTALHPPAQQQGSSRAILEAAEKAYTCGTFDDRVKLLRSAVDAAKTEDPTAPDWSVPFDLLAASRRDAPGAILRQALSVREDKLGKDHPSVALSLDALALEYESALRELEKKPYSPTFEPRSVNRPDPRLLSMQIARQHAEREQMQRMAIDGRALMDQKAKFSSAEQLYARAYDIREKAFGPESAEAAASLANMARFQGLLGRKKKAQELSEKAMTLWHKLVSDVEVRSGTEHLDIAAPLTDLAQALQEEGKLNEAEPLLARALAIRQKELGGANALVLESTENLARNLAAQKKYDAAEPVLRRAVSIRAAIFGKEHPAVAKGLYNFGDMLWHSGRKSEADGAYTQGREIRTRYKQSVCSGKSGS